VTSIHYNREVLGRLCLNNNEHFYLSQLMLEFIAGLISIELYKQKQFSDAAKRRLDFIHDLLSGDSNRNENMINRSHYLGIELNQTMGLMVLDIDDFVKFAMSHEEQYVDNIKEQMYLNATYAVDMHSIIIPRSDKLIVLIPLQKGNDLQHEKACLETAHTLRKIISEKITCVTTTIGIGSICKNLLDLRISYLEAIEAISVGRVALGKDRIINYPELGAFLLLPSILRDNPDLSTLFTSWLGKIIDYDRSKGTELLKTIETYLETNCDISETIAIRHIHRNTLRYRLEKINELTDNRLKVSGNKFHYLLLIKIWRLSK
jgi:purine catabolism regulator